MNKNRAFTLIELLTVIAIIGILAAILIPTVGAVRVSANKAKTKTQFGQWATAMEMFRQEYGFYPKIASGTAYDGKLDTDLFLRNLTARSATGTKYTSTSDLKSNRRGIAFYSVSSDELSSTSYGDASDNLLIDAFRNLEIGIMVDSNLDGKISGSTTQLTSVDGGTMSTISVDVRAGVIFYSPGKGAMTGKTVSTNDIVKTWE